MSLVFVLVWRWHCCIELTFRFGSTQRLVGFEALPQRYLQGIFELSNTLKNDPFLGEWHIG